MRYPAGDLRPVTALGQTLAGSIHVDRRSGFDPGPHGSLSTATGKRERTFCPIRRYRPEFLSVACENERLVDKPFAVTREDLHEAGLATANSTNAIAISNSARRG
jgi:hypothetical protein